MTDPKPHVTREAAVADERWGDTVSWRTLISGDRMPTEGITLGTAEIQPGAPATGACHRHVQPEVYFVLAGEGHVTIDDTDHPLAPGTAVFVPGNAWHVVTNTGAETLRLVYVFAVDGFDDVVYEHRDGGPPV